MPVKVIVGNSLEKSSGELKSIEIDVFGGQKKLGTEESAVSSRAQLNDSLVAGRPFFPLGSLAVDRAGLAIGPSLGLETRLLLDHRPKTWEELWQNDRPLSSQFKVLTL